MHLPCKFDTFEESSTVPPFEDVDHGSEHEDPATEALEEHGESIPPPKILVLPLWERLFVGPMDTRVRDCMIKVTIEKFYSSKLVVKIKVLCYLLVNGVVKSKNSAPKNVISGKVGSICSLKYSMAIVDKSNNSSVTLYALPSDAFSLI